MTNLFVFVCTFAIVFGLDRLGRFIEVQTDKIIAEIKEQAKK